MRFRGREEGEYFRADEDSHKIVVGRVVVHARLTEGGADPEIRRSRRGGEGCGCKGWGDGEVENGSV